MANHNGTRTNLDRTISDLVSRLNKSDGPKNWATLFWFSWISCLSIMSILTYIAAAFFPNDIHLPQNTGNFAFWAEIGLWFSLALLSAGIAYVSGFPTRSTRKLLNFAYTAAVLMGVVLFTRESPSAVASEFVNEIHLHRGPCGFFILITGFVSMCGMFYILKKAAPIDLSFTGLWTALSVGALSSMFMHLVCTHESTAHTLLWHVTPVILLMIMGLTLSPRLLRW